MECKDSCSRYHKMLPKAAFPPCTWRGINGFVNLWMISPRWKGQQVLIICFDHVDSKRLSALCSEKPVEVTNWSEWGVCGKCDPLTCIQEMCWWVLKYTIQVSESVYMYIYKPYITKVRPLRKDLSILSWLIHFLNLSCIQHENLSGFS